MASPVLDPRFKDGRTIRSPSLMKRKTKYSINMGNTGNAGNTTLQNTNLPELRAFSPQSKSKVSLLTPLDQFMGTTMAGPPILENPGENSLFKKRYRVKSPEVRINSPTGQRKKSRIESKFMCFTM